jgi:hypothetical protein
MPGDNGPGTGPYAGASREGGAITRAVAASVRHQDTGYDALLMSGVPRDAARDQVRPAIDQVLATWHEASRR